MPSPSRSNVFGVKKPDYKKPGSSEYILGVKSQDKGRKTEPKLIKHPYTEEVMPITEIQPIQGIMPDSKEEYWVALALNKLKIKYIFQYKLGKPGRRGSQKIDFMLETKPLRTPLWVNGLYWHSEERAGETLYKIRDAMRSLRGTVTKEIIIWDYEIPTEADTIAVVTAKVGKQ